MTGEDSDDCIVKSSVSSDVTNEGIHEASHSTPIIDHIHKRIDNLSIGIPVIVFPVSIRRMWYFPIIYLCCALVSFQSRCPFHESLGHFPTRNNQRISRESLKSRLQVI